MCQLVESIRVNNGECENIFYHNKRLNHTRRELFDCTDIIDLNKAVLVPEEFSSGIVKCRVLYEKKITKITFEKYTPRQISTLKCVEGNDIDYRYKYTDRDFIQRLCEKKGSADDILIIQQGSVTDTSYSNIAFLDGAKWLTPSTPLLNGTRRQQLLDEGLIEEADIQQKDISSFKLASLINSMLDLNDLILKIHNIS